MVETPLSSPSFLLVGVAGQVCALPIASVVEVLRAGELKRGCSGIPALLGMLTLRGELVAVLDLALLLGLSPSPNVGSAQCEPARLVAVRLGSHRAVLAVDQVVGVRLVDPASITPIALPGGEEHRMGLFDTDFARLLEAGGLVDEHAWAALAEGSA